MENQENYLSELREIRQMMEQSSRFLSLSGLSGILIGLYALVGAFLASRMIYVNSDSFFSVITESMDKSLVLLIFSIILILSLITIFLLTTKKVKKSGKNFWNPGSRLMVINLAIPLLTGGCMIIIFINQSLLYLLPALSLLFYGLALVNAAKFTRHEIFYIGILQIVLGIFASIFPSMGLFFWTLGFGIVHIVYGTFMYIKYEKNTESA